ncbi:hypothetical protein [Halalkalibacter lacteus]
MKKEQKYKISHFSKQILLEVRDSIAISIIWNVMAFFPKLIIRIFRNLF